MTADEEFELLSRLGAQSGMTVNDWICIVDEMRMFMRLVSQHEREACAALCEHLSLDGLSGHQYADAIRARADREENP